MQVCEVPVPTAMVESGPAYAWTGTASPVDVTPRPESVSAMLGCASGSIVMAASLALAFKASKPLVFVVDLVAVG
jgi:hypothetical protein